jgi:putative ABC transport system substrate-binding protein
MRRRDFMVLAVGGAVWPLAVHAQHPQKIFRIGVLLPGTPASFSLRTKALLDGLRDLGHVEGKTVAIEWKWGQDRVETLSGLAAELMRSNVDVIVTGGTAAAKALKAATQQIPIVVAIIGDPVAAGLVENLARPSGNLTGFSIVAPELGGKRLELLKEIVPHVSAVSVLLNVKNPQSQIELKEMQTAAEVMGLQLYPAEISAEVGLEDAFAAINKAKASSHKLPAMYFFQGFVEDGGLMSYGPSDADLFRRAAGYVDRILKGAKPGDLPIEQPTKFDLVINLKAAKALGINIPESCLVRADQVIE